MQSNDFICDVCGESCAKCAVPLVAYLVVGTPPSYSGPPVDLNAAGVKVPAIIRELMAQPVARREWCVSCFSRAFNLPLVEASAVLR